MVAPHLPVGPAWWVTDPRFDLRNHLSRRIAPADGSSGALLDLVALQLQAPLPADRPLWEATYLERFDGDRAALLLKAGHALTDGVGALQLLGALVGPGRSTPARTAPPSPDQTTAADLTLAGLRDLPTAIFGAFNRATRGRPDISEVVAQVARQTRVVRPAAAGSPVLAGRSHRRAVLVAEVATDELRHAAARLGGTVNDLYLAILASAFGTYHREAGSGLACLPLAMPVNVQPDRSATSLGNHWTVLQLPLPLLPDDPAALVLAIGAMVRAARAEAPDATFDGMARLAALLPDPLLHAALARAPRPDLQASNIAGPSDALRIAGGQVTRIIPFAPLPGCAAMATLLSACGRSVIGVHYDPAAITDAGAFQRCLEDSIVELTRRSA